MDNELVFEQVKEVIEDFFDDDLDITFDTVASDIDGWDSLAHISILASLEEHFQIRFSVDDSQKMTNVGAMVSVVAELMN